MKVFISTRMWESKNKNRCVISLISLFFFWKISRMDCGGDLDFDYVFLDRP